MFYCKQNNDKLIKNNKIIENNNNNKIIENNNNNKIIEKNNNNNNKIIDENLSESDDFISLSDELDNELGLNNI
jgi:hypothetical protein